MTVLAERVHIAGRFKKSIRIDIDLAESAYLEGFVCSRTFVHVVESMARHVAEGGQGAFTWTGPYGVGKSSLVIALSALLQGDRKITHKAKAIFGAKTANAVWDALPPRTKGWRVLPVIGRRAPPAQVLGEAIEKSKFIRRGRSGDWSDEETLAALERIARRDPKKTGGLIVFIDEMGKFLEGGASEGFDIYFFQQLAELAARSTQRLIVVGILHQAFEEYANRLSRAMRDEWAKIQGRFVDIVMHVNAEEQLDLLSRALAGGPGSDQTKCLVTRVAALTGGQAPAALLLQCWPLHPVVACLLGPISRRRFGQNQRSVFGFLNSTEPLGFQDFLRNAQDVDALYTPDMLWDYLRVNLEPTLVASPDGHRWVMAVDALERCRGVFGEGLHTRILKTIGLVGLFKERSGLAASLDLLETALPNQEAAAIKQAVMELEERSLVIYRKFTGEYSIFEGSDFDIEKAIDKFHEAKEDVDFSWLSQLAGLQPIMAKRHYH